MKVWNWEQRTHDWIAARSRRILGPLRWANIVLGGAEVVGWVPVAAMYALVFTQIIDSWSGAAAMGLAAVAAKDIEWWLKQTFDRRRPNGEPLGIPSGDVMQASIWALPILGLWGLVPVAVVAWGRIAQSKHYPLDVLLGALLGAACAGPPWWLLR